MRLIRLTHANLKETIYVPVEQITGWYKSPGNGCTHVVCPGTVFPALETPEEVERLYNQGKKPKEKPNGNARSS